MKCKCTEVYLGPLQNLRWSSLWHKFWEDVQIFLLAIISAFVRLKPALHTTPIHLAKSASSLEVKKVLKKEIKWFKTERSLIMNNIMRSLNIVAIWQMKGLNITFINKNYVRLAHERDILFWLYYSLLSCIPKMIFSNL